MWETLKSASSLEVEAVIAITKYLNIGMEDIGQEKNV